MSFLDLLEDDSLSDSQLLQAVMEMEKNYSSKSTNLWSDLSNLLLLCDVEQVEQFADPTDDEVMQQVMQIESSLEPLL